MATSGNDFYENPLTWDYLTGYDMWEEAMDSFYKGQRDALISRFMAAQAAGQTISALDLLWSRTADTCFFNSFVTDFCLDQSDADTKEAFYADITTLIREDAGMPQAIRLSLPK